MSYTIGDGIVAIALAAGIVGYMWVVHQTRRRRLEIIHQERLVAMEKGIPLPEFPLEQVPQTSYSSYVIPILGIVLLSLSIGTMIVIYFTATNREFWVAPMPFAFLGVGLLTFHVLNKDANR
jgi:hypothetical protein